MFVTHLNKRRKKILQAIVELYIETASPISSQVITQRLRSRISAATIRNVMAELDEIGYIWQPHTSAGRIPTDKGYRYYIDSLLEVEQLTQQECQLIASQYPMQNEVFDELLKEILRTLSSFSGYTALAFSPGLRRILLKRLELISVEPKGLLVVLVSQEGLVKTAVVQLPSKMDERKLQKITKFLNEMFAGLTLDEIKERLALQIMTAADKFFDLQKKSAQILNFAFTSFEKDKLYFEGTSHILEQPEFQDTHKLQAVLRTFEQQEPLLQIMKEDLNNDGVRVHIGKENPCADIQECSLVISNFKLKNRTMGSIGILGPRRMSYQRVISTVSYVARTFSERMAM